MNELSKAQSAVVAAALGRHERHASALLPVLQEIQQAIGHIPPAAVPELAEALSLSRAEVHGVISFYHQLHGAERGKTTVQVCAAEACQAVGGRALGAHVSARLGIAAGETSADGALSLDTVYCLGNCACGPSVRVNDEVFGRVTPARFEQLVDELGLAEKRA